MRIRLTSDVHGDIPTIEAFSKLLSGDEFDMGVIAGDILDDGFTSEHIASAVASGALDSDDFVPELPGDDEDTDSYMARQRERLRSTDGPFRKMIGFLETRARFILEHAGKPVLVIRGNHDQSEWVSEGFVSNIEERRVDFDGYSFVGYRWTALDRSEAERRGDLQRLLRMVDRRTVLVTHDAPYGILDSVPDETGSARSIGSPYLRRLSDGAEPALHVFGHVHASFGRKGRCVNVSYPGSRAFVSVDLPGMEMTTIPVQGGNPVGGRSE